VRQRMKRLQGNRLCGKRSKAGRLRVEEALCQGMKAIWLRDEEDMRQGMKKLLG
jgi:hypothetical protein